jgi:hypothetical protein
MPSESSPPQPGHGPGAPPSRAKEPDHLVRIVSPEWMAWIRIGGKKSTTPDKGQKEKGFGATWERYFRNYRLDSDAPSRREAISKRNLAR